MQTLNNWTLEIAYLIKFFLTIAPRCRRNFELLAFVASFCLQMNIEKNLNFTIKAIYGVEIRAEMQK